MTTTYIDKLAFVEIQNQRLLVTLSHGKDMWYVPGGKRIAGETDQQALIREVKEELNVDLNPATIMYFGVIEAQAHGKPEGTLVRMTCYTGSYTGTIQASSEIEKVDWFSCAQKDQTSLASRLLFDALQAKGLVN